MPTPARRPKRSPRRLRKFYAMIVKVFTLARVAKLADARDLKSRVPKGTYRFNSGPGHHAFIQCRATRRAGLEGGKNRNESTRSICARRLCRFCRGLRLNLIRPNRN